MAAPAGGTPCGSQLADHRESMRVLAVAVDR